MNSREELVEEAAKAMAILDDYDGCFERLAGTDPEEPLSTDEEDAEFWRKRARVALAVFEKAHAPTGDERAFANALRADASRQRFAMRGRETDTSARLDRAANLIDRRTVQSEPTNAEV